MSDVQTAELILQAVNAVMNGITIIALAYIGARWGRNGPPR